MYFSICGSSSSGVSSSIVFSWLIPLVVHFSYVTSVPFTGTHTYWFPSLSSITSPLFQSLGFSVPSPQFASSVSFGLNPAGTIGLSYVASGFWPVIVVFSSPGSPCFAFVFVSIVSDCFLFPTLSIASTYTVYPLPAFRFVYSYVLSSVSSLLSMFPA